MGGMSIKCSESHITGKKKERWVKIPSSVNTWDRQSPLLQKESDENQQQCAFGVAPGGKVCINSEHISTMALSQSLPRLACGRPLQQQLQYLP